MGCASGARPIFLGEKFAGLDRDLGTNTQKNGTIAIREIKFIL